MRVGFSMVEIAIALGIIAFALVAIIGILPFGLTVQRESREETIINGDAQYFMEALRSGQRSQADLTNFVENVVVDGITNNFNSSWEIVGLLTTPDFTGTNYNHINYAYVRALTSTAEDRRQDDQGFSFRYRLGVEVRPIVTQRTDHQDRFMLSSNAWDIRLVFQWPLLPNGGVGREQLVYPGLVSGSISHFRTNNVDYYFLVP